MKKVVLSSFAGESALEKMKAASAYLRVHEGAVLIIEPGVYEITTPLAKQTLADALGGVYGKNPEPVMFSPAFKYDVGLDLHGMKDVTVLADGATLMIDGFMEPVSIRDSLGVKVCGLTVDHKRKPYSRGTILEVAKDYITVAFDDASYLCDDFPMPRYALADPATGLLYRYGYPDIYGKIRIDEKTWKLTGKNFEPCTLGFVFYAWHTFHSRPAILIQDSRNVTLRNVTIHTQPGMGVVAHRSRDLTFKNLSVIPSGGDHISTNTDATHISSCGGEVVYDRCTFIGQGDDSLNVHNYYHTVTAQDGRTLTVINEAPTGTHSQAQDHPDIGDVVELTDFKTLGVIARARVADFELLDVRTCRVTLDRDVDGAVGLMMADATQCPRLTVRRCTMKRHIARGALIKTKRALIENNVFEDITGTAIEVAAESWWREGLCSTEKIVIRRNTIQRCGGAPGVRDSGGIAVTVDCDEPVIKTHADVTVEKNFIECPAMPHAVYISNTKRADVRRNHLVCASDPLVIKQD